MDQRGKKIGRCCLVFAAAAVSASPLRSQQSITTAMASQTERLVPQSALESADLGTPPTTLEEALRAMFQSADTVFTGELTEIKRGPNAVVVRWRVEDAVRGPQPGSFHDLREWPGLWEGNGARYVVGERALVMLQAKSAAGYASPVAGGDGIIPMRGDAPNSILDLRMLAQHVAVTDAARLRQVEALRRAGGSLTLSDALQVRQAALAHSVAPLQRAPDSGGGLARQSAEAGSTAASAAKVNRSVDGAMVLGLLHAWQREKASAK